MFKKMQSTEEIGSVEELKLALESLPASLRERLRDEIQAVLIELSQDYLAELAA